MLEAANLGEMIATAVTDWLDTQTPAEMYETLAAHACLNTDHQQVILLPEPELSEADIRTQTWIQFTDFFHEDYAEDAYFQEHNLRAGRIMNLEMEEIEQLETLPSALNVLLGWQKSEEDQDILSKSCAEMMRENGVQYRWREEEEEEQKTMLLQICVPLPEKVRRVVQMVFIRHYLNAVQPADAGINTGGRLN